MLELEPRFQVVVGLVGICKKKKGWGLRYLVVKCVRVFVCLLFFWGRLGGEIGK